MSNDRLNQAFGPYLRPGPGLPDGRSVVDGNLGASIAARLIERDPAGSADEIIKLMKPLCRRFDLVQMRAHLAALDPVPSAVEGVMPDGLRLSRRDAEG